MRDGRPGYHLTDRRKIVAAKSVIAKDQHGQRRAVNTTLWMSTRIINGGTDPNDVDVHERDLIKPVSQIRRMVSEH